MSQFGVGLNGKDMADLIQFLRNRNVPETYIRKLNDEKIDHEVLLLMSDEEMKNYIPCYGDRLAAVAFCKANSSETASSQLLSDTVQKIKQKISERKRRSNVFKENDAPRSTPKYAGRPKKTTRRVEFGWLHFNEISKSFQMVRTKTGGGTRHLSVDIDFGADVLIPLGRDLFFPDGVSAHGNVNEHCFSIKDFQLRDIGVNTIGSLYETSKVKTLRLYLCSKRNGGEGGACSNEGGLKPPDDDTVSVEDPVPSTSSSGTDGPQQSSVEVTVISSDDDDLLGSSQDSVRPPGDSGTPTIQFNHSSLDGRNTTALRFSGECSNNTQKYANLISYSDSEEELQAAISGSIDEANKIAASKETSICERFCTKSEVVAEMMSRINKENNPTFMNVVRGHVLDGAIRAMTRSHFEPDSPLSVKFMDDVGASEGAIDEGGPAREFFTLAIWELQHCSHIFAGKEGMTIVPSQIASERDMYFFAGQLMAMALAHGAQAPRILSKRMYEWISRGYNYAKLFLSLEDLPDTELSKQLHCINEASTIKELQEKVMKIESYLDVAGCNLFIRKLEDKERIVRAVIQFHVMDRVRSQMERFQEGLSALGVLQLIKANPIACEDLLCYSKSVLNFQCMSTLFTQELSPVGSNRRVIELEILGFWNDYLVDINEKEADVQFHDLLQFSTGSSTVPPCGFPCKPSIEFLPKDKNSIYPTANTCSCIIRLPTLHAEYKDFKRHMDFGILNAVGFGQA